MRTNEQIAECGRKVQELRSRYQQTCVDDTDTVAALDKELEALVKEIGEDESRVLAWIDEQEWLVEMCRGGGVFDADGHYIPVTRR